MAKESPVVAARAAALYTCEARVLPEVISTAGAAGMAPAEELGDEYSVRHVLAEGLPVQFGDQVLIGYDLRGLEPVYVVEGSLPTAYSQLTGVPRVLRPA